MKLDRSSKALAAKQAAYYRALADRVERAKTTARDEYVVDAIEDALSAWKAGSPAWRKRAVSRVAR